MDHCVWPFLCSYPQSQKWAGNHSQPDSRTRVCHFLLYERRILASGQGMSIIPTLTGTRTAHTNNFYGFWLHVPISGWSFGLHGCHSTIQAWFPWSRWGVHQCLLSQGDITPYPQFRTTNSSRLLPCYNCKSQRIWYQLIPLHRP